MRHLKKMTALLVAVVMMMALSAVAWAADDGSIAVKTNFNEQTYKLYKLFDAQTVAGRVDGGEGISYKLMEGKTDLKATSGSTTIDGATWFDIDSVGNVTLKSDASISESNADFAAWAAAYGAQVGEALTATSDNDSKIKWTGLGEGYYYITTTTGSLVTVDSIKPNVEVNDKNTVPTVDKKITGASNISDEGKKALAQIGTDVEYTATVTIGKGSKNVKFHDKMDEGLDFVANSITVEGIGDNDYEVLATADPGDTFTIKFKDGIAENTKITIKYRATITKNALTKLENDAKVTYGDNNTSTQESKTETYNAEIYVIKYDGDKSENKFLADAGFKLKNSEGKYYKLTGTTVSWEDNETDGDEHKSVATDGKVPAFTGLAAGEYTLVETTTPAGYNTAADTKITIAAGTYTEANLSQKAEIENHSGAELPSTGGMGTTILYIVGAVLVIGAVVLLITRRRLNAEK